ncbi:adenosine kinase isoform X3 [Cryptotermes secundus]|uniref:adenosine kinase isoform X3 n=1 Tax=Cryptotermes secundus TaxID=105785 RepID=UPI000CD7C995|nr:adenosine kinase isoform X3 [Cryptotermes secundus]
MENRMECILEKYKPPIIAAFGNPLLDMCTTISDSNILDKYGLVPNGQKEVSDGDLKIFRDIRNSFTVEYHPGGAAQNTLRIFQWLISYPFYSVFFGAVGNDDEGKLIEKLVKNSGVETRYKYHDDYPTGSCLALINGENRSLIGHLGAANMYEPSDLLQHMQILDQSTKLWRE